jgi:hypothetical protein
MSLSRYVITRRKAAVLKEKTARKGAQPPATQPRKGGDQDKVEDPEMREAAQAPG